MSGNIPPSTTPQESDRIRSLLSEYFRQIGDAPDKDARDRIFDSLTRSIIQADVVVSVLNRLLNEDDNGKRIALEISQRLPIPISKEIIPFLLPLIPMSRFSSTGRMKVAANIYQSFPESSPQANQVLQALTADVPREKGLERLKRLRDQIAQSSQLNQFYGEHKQGDNRDCPRCGVRLNQANLAKHLWEEHRLLLNGDQVRDPWQQIEVWLYEYNRTGEVNWLDKSCDLGQQIDPDQGLFRVHRLLVMTGKSDARLQAKLRSDALQNRSTLCPNCYTMIPEGTEQTPVPMTISGGRIAGQGYNVEVSDHQLTSWLLINTPEGDIYWGLEPSHNLTRQGRVFLQTLPFAILAVFASLFLPPPFLFPVVVLSVLIGIGIYLSIRISEKRKGNPIERAVNHAWSGLAPKLQSPEYRSSDALFAAGLAEVSLGRGIPTLREPEVHRISKINQDAVASRLSPPEFLTALRRLEIDDAQRLDRDTIVMLANEYGYVLSGKLPLRYVEQLVAYFPPESLRRGDRSRLRILLLAHAFESGWEALDLQQLGRLCPSFGQLYASEDVNGMARLRCLWQIKSQRPWQALGAANPVFDIARYPGLGGNYLESHPDLLLFQPMSEEGFTEDSISPILICEEGLVYRSVVINHLQTKIRVVPQSSFYGAFNLIIGSEMLAFSKDPTPLANRLWGWRQFLLNEFLPQVPSYLTRRSPKILNQLMQQKLVTCPECQKSLLSIRGEVGISVDETEN
jgi:hypothetical protein